jgi:ubiquinone/menaquinone biosynthesis C-methylase UbiE
MSMGPTVSATAQPGTRHRDEILGPSPMQEGEHRDPTRRSAVPIPPAGTQVRRQAHNKVIERHFSPLAPEYLRLKQRNHFYNDQLIQWCRSVLPPGRRVIDFGCGRGDVLAAVEPSTGIGIDLCQSFVDAASAQFPHLRFERSPIEEVTVSEPFDAVLLVNTMEYVYDIGTVLDRAHDVLRENGRLLITTANPVWSPLFKLASRLGLRIPDCKRLFMTNEDVANMLKLHGFDILMQKTTLIVPKYIPFVSRPVNWLVSRLPMLRVMGSTQLVMARKMAARRREYSVSVVVPCYNESDNIERCIREMRPIGSSTELIFVDDGSTDGTYERVAQVLNENPRNDIHVRAIRYTPNQGKWRAVKTGFDNAVGDIVMVLDADMTTHPEELLPLYEAFATGRAEFINCTRLVYPMDDGSMKFLNFVGNKVFTILVSLVMETRVSDTLCGTKAMFRDDYRHFMMGRDRWGDYDLLFGAAQQRLRVQELPVHYRARTAGLSKMNSVKHTINLLKMCWHGFWQVKTLRGYRSTATPTEAANRG